MNEQCGRPPLSATIIVLPDRATYGVTTDRSHERPGRPQPDQTRPGRNPKYRDRVMHRPNSSAAELLTSTGLIALGPIAWGSPVTSDAPGVYVVESAEPSDAAPIDSSALGGVLTPL